MKKYLHYIDMYKWFILTIALFAGAFYWYEWRPAQTEKECALFAVPLLKDAKTLDYNSIEVVFGLCVNVGGVDNMVGAYE